MDDYGEVETYEEPEVPIDNEMLKKTDRLASVCLENVQFWEPRNKRQQALRFRAIKNLVELKIILGVK